MSDFDKEAEREKLREQFADDEEKREATERMSDLLLQGATMTNTHCDTCSSPIFTYEGQSFCPTCQVEVDTGGGTAARESAESDTATDRPDSTASPEGSDPTARGKREATGNSSTRIEVNDPETGADRPSTSAEPRASSQLDSEPRGSPSPAADPAPTAEPARTRPDVNDGTGSVGDAGTGDTDLAAAQASLSHTLTRLSSEAERSEDLSRTREYLQGAREAADALAALKQARR